MSPRARRRRVSGVLLAPGAGASRDHRTLTALEAGLRLPVERVDFPYRKAGRRAPDRTPVLVQSLREDVAALAARLDVEPSALVLGGRSMGGRMCSMLVAEGQPAAGLVLLSYPLHPPGTPEKLRVEHFPALGLPCLFVTGTRDPFGTPAELEAHTADIPGPVSHVWLEGQGHEPKDDATIVAAVAAWLAQLR